MATCLTKGASSGPRQTTTRKGPVRVLVVDDSVVMRQLISRMLGSDAAFEVAAFARNGLDAVSKVQQFKPDLVTLDVEMPELDGLGALRLIKEQYPNTRVIMCSSLTARGASITIDALMLGADDYVTKQRSGEMTQNAFDSLRDQLLGKVRQLFNMDTPEAPPAPMSQLTLKPQAQQMGPRASLVSGKRPVPKVLAIGVSTGGPAALAELLPAFPEDFPLPIVIVQHMPPCFTTSLAERLNRLSHIRVAEASAGMSLKAGQALLAPGDFHMRLVRKGHEVLTKLDQGEPECFCRPAVDVLFRSVADVFSGAAIATILTGMGQDGLAGVRLLSSLGATVFVQSKETSVVWGMPGAVASANLADAVLPLNQIYPSIARQV